MKNLLILLVFFLSANISFGQMVVSDPEVSANLKLMQKTQVSTYAKAVASLEQMNKMREQYDKVIENVESVSSYVRSGKQIINIKKLIQEITSEYSKGVNYTKNESIIKPKDKIVFITTYSKMLKRSLEDLEYSTKIISEGNLKMNDAERLSILGNIETKMQHNKELIRYFNSKIKNTVTIKKQELVSAKYIESSKNSFNNISN